MRPKLCLKVMAVLAVLTMALALAPSVWAASKYKSLYDLKGGKNGAGPSGALISDAAGNLYGVTATGGGGGGRGCGTVFELVRSRSGWSQRVIYRFPASAKDGCLPSTNLAFDAEGNLYGTTMRGGQGDCFGGKCGVVFELTQSSTGQWKETVLHRFAGGNDGAIPTAGIVLDAAGNVYGTTEDGGGTSCTCGTVFELTPKAGGDWIETILHSFSGTDGSDPSGLSFDSTGNLYGVADTGGSYDVGVAFELSPGSGGVWTESVLYDFSSDGEFPVSGLTFSGGNLYGATIAGGPGNWGTIFELTPSGSSWTHQVLYSFKGRKDGRSPAGMPVFDSLGNLYGSTDGDVTCTKGNHWGCGNVFELTPRSRGEWKERVLHTFTGERAGAYPGELTFGEGGNLYGNTSEGGNGPCGGGGWSGCGVVFEVTP